MWLVFPQCFMPSIHTTQCALSGEEIAADPLCGHKPLSIWPWSPIRTASFNQWDASNGSSSSWRLCPVFKSQTIGIIMSSVYFATMRAISFQQGHELDEVPFSSANHQYAIKECHKLVDKRLNTKVHQDSTTSWERKTSIKNSWSYRSENFVAPQVSICIWIMSYDAKPRIKNGYLQFMPVPLLK